MRDGCSWVSTNGCDVAQVSAAAEYRHACQAQQCETSSGEGTVIWALKFATPKVGSPLKATSGQLVQLSKLALLGWNQLLSAGVLLTWKLNVPSQLKFYTSNDQPILLKLLFVMTPRREGRAGSRARS